jgi:hypothetical protein
MNVNDIVTLLCSGGFAACLVGILSIRSQLRQQAAAADKAEAETDSVRITNTESATRVLSESIINPLRDELNATRKELAALSRVVKKLKEAIDRADACPHRIDCPVMAGVREQEKNDGASGGTNGGLSGSGENGTLGGDNDQAAHRGGRKRIRTPPE